MIIPNGTLQPLVKAPSQGGIDLDTGYPVPPTEAEWGEAVPCQWLAASMNLQALTAATGSAHAKVSLVAYIELTPSFDGIEQVRLCHPDGTEVGTFAVIQPEPLPAVGQLRLYL